ncbi:tetratricopeptide repeat protein, partial [Aliarcobacter butzleri]|nr:tetratricopeptide repeat protein [Aliarcobacter butzleri]
MEVFKKLVYKILFGIFIFNSILYANNDLLESQPEIIFETERLLDSQENLEIQVDFNKAVLHLKKGEYEEAIKIFEKTALVIEVPSLLNMGIAYYKLKDTETAKSYLNKIYEKKSNLVNQTFSFISACYYLY